jgi:hypothetical protein
VGDPQHAPVGGEHLADEFGDTQAVCSGGEVFQQQGADAAPVVVVGDEDGELGAWPVTGPFAGRYPDQAVALVGQQCQEPVRLRAAQPIDLGGQGGGAGEGEEPQAQVLR